MPVSLPDDVAQSAQTTYGIVPNFFRETNRYTGMPGVVYMAADEALMDGLLSPAEQQAVLLELARYHGTRYDAVVHARMALDSGLPPSVVDAILADERVSDDGIRALVEATRISCEERGWVDAETLSHLEQRGVSRGKLYEIFALIGMKAFSGFTHHLAGTPVDDALKETEQSLRTVPDKPDVVKRERLFVG